MNSVMRFTKISNSKIRTKFFVLLLLLLITFTVVILIFNSASNINNEGLHEIIANDLTQKDIAMQMHAYSNQLLVSSSEFQNEIKEIDFDNEDIGDTIDLVRFADDYDSEAISEFFEVIENFDSIVLALDELDIEVVKVRELFTELDHNFHLMVDELSSDTDGYFQDIIRLRVGSGELEGIIGTLITNLDLLEIGASSGIIELIDNIRDTLYYSNLRMQEYIFEGEENGADELYYLMNKENDSSALQVEGEFDQLFTMLGDLETQISSNTTAMKIFGDIEGIALDIQYLIVEMLDGVDEMVEDHETLDITAEKQELISEELISMIIADNEVEIAEQAEIYNNQRLIALGVAIIGFILALLLTIIISQSSTMRASEIIKHLELIGEGKFTDFELSDMDKSEFGVIAHGVQDMKNRLQELILSVNETSQTLGQVTHEYSSTVEEIGASSSEITSTSQAISDGMNNQTELAYDVKAHLEDILLHIESVIQKIQLNTNVVTQISLKTNILALNAGIEASKAGDYGRGFSVVANNIRTLSDESKSATEQIAIIANEVSNSLKDAFDSIYQDMVNIVAISEENAASAEEIAAATEEVNASLDELNQSTIILSDQISSSKIFNLGAELKKYL